MTISQAASGRWWWACTRPCCDAYKSGYPERDDAIEAAKRHEERSHQ